MPYFLWCLRDFMLQTDKNEDSDDYMESVLTIKNLDTNSSKYKIRKSFSEFFSQRGCLFFVRPLNDESLIRQIDK